MNKSISAISFAVVAALAFSAGAQSVIASNKPLPSMKSARLNGALVSAGQLSSSPTLLVFINQGCPHNPKAVPGLNRLSAQLKGKIRVLGVVNSGEKEAKAYASSIGAKFPIISDPKQELIGALGATHSLDLASVGLKAKSAGKVWNGISRQAVQEAIRSLQPKSATADLAWFPEAKQSGCGF